MLKKNDIYEQLLCPDCFSSLVFKDSLKCPFCNRDFHVDGRKMSLLPSNLSAADLAEEQFWATDPREGLKAPAWLSLIVKRDSILHFIEEVLPKLKVGGKVLEIGSGSCWLSSLIKLAFPETQIVASDVSYSALEKGSQVSGLLGSELDFFVACKVERLPFESEFFDHVIGSAVLHHTITSKAICEVFRSLKKNGTYVGVGELAVPSVLAPLLRTERSGKKNRSVKVRNYSLSQWRNFFTQAGFKEVTFNLERNPEYKQYHWFINLYYRLISKLPTLIVRTVLPCSIGVVAAKEKDKKIDLTCL